jgi:hypothetical protein
MCRLAAGSRRESSLARARPAGLVRSLARTRSLGRSTPTARLHNIDHNATPRQRPPRSGRPNWRHSRPAETGTSPTVALASARGCRPVLGARAFAQPSRAAAGRLTQRQTPRARKSIRWGGRHERARATALLLPCQPALSQPDDIQQGGVRARLSVATRGGVRARRPVRSQRLKRAGRSAPPRNSPARVHKSGRAVVNGIPDGVRAPRRPPSKVECAQPAASRPAALFGQLVAQKGARATVCPARTTRGGSRAPAGAPTHSSSFCMNFMNF